MAMRAVKVRLRLLVNLAGPPVETKLKLEERHLQTLLSQRVLIRIRLRLGPQAEQQEVPNNRISLDTFLSPARMLFSEEVMTI